MRLGGVLLACVAGAGIVLLAPVRAHAQMNTPGGLPVPVQPVPEMRLPRGVMRRQREAANEARQKKVVDDTAKLVALTREVSDSLQQSNGAMTNEIAKDLNEIERLAHEVRSKELE